MSKFSPATIYPWIKSRLTLSFFILCGCLFLLALFGWLSQEVLEQETFGFDTTILLWLHQYSNSWIDSLMLGLTNLANPEFVVILVAISLGVLLWYRRVWAAQIFGLNCLGGLILNQGLKLIFVKPRPKLWTPLVVEHSYSFPSGHALGSLVLYGFLAVLLADRYPRYRIGIYISASSIIMAIGLSRLFLGVHYPTDIIAGYAVGFVWLTTCVWILRMR
jgi:membrane-associated phospholipid phosphatase